MNFNNWIEEIKSTKDTERFFQLWGMFKKDIASDYAKGSDKGFRSHPVNDRLEQEKVKSEYQLLRALSTFRRGFHFLMGEPCEDEILDKKEMGIIKSIVLPYFSDSDSWLVDKIEKADEAFIPTFDQLKIGLENCEGEYGKLGKIQGNALKLAQLFVQGILPDVVVISQLLQLVEKWNKESFNE